MKIYIGDASETVRPFSLDDINGNQSFDNWRLIVDEPDAQMALQELIEELNNENINLSNSWLRIG